MSYSGKHRNNKPQDSTSTWLTVEDLDKYLKSGKPYDGQIVSVTANRTAYLIAGAPGSFYKIPIGSRTYTASSSQANGQDPVYYRNPTEIPFVNADGDGLDYNSSFYLNGNLLQIPYYFQSGSGAGAASGAQVSYWTHTRSGEARHRFENPSTADGANVAHYLTSNAGNLVTRQHGGGHTATILDTLVPKANLSYIGSTGSGMLLTTTEVGADMIFATENIEAMRIDGTTQHVGINNESPAYTLDILNDTATGTVANFVNSVANSANIRLNATTAGGLEWAFTSTATAHPDGGGLLKIKVVGTSDDILNLDGVNNRVGIMNAAPQATLHMDGGRFRIGDEGAGTRYTELWHQENENFRLDTSNGGYVFYTQGTLKFQIRGSGTSYFLNTGIGIGYTASVNDNNLAVSGSVGIGTATPAYELDVTGTTQTDDLIVNIDPAGTGTTWKSDQYGMTMDTTAYSQSHAREIKFDTIDSRQGHFGIHVSGTTIDKMYWSIGDISTGHNLTQSIVLKRAGNVGIGNISPSYRLDVNSLTEGGTVRFTSANVYGTNLYLENTALGGHNFSFGSAANSSTYPTSSLVIIDQTSGNHLMTLDGANQRVGIANGTTAPAYVLDVEGTTIKATTDILIGEAVFTNPTSFVGMSSVNWAASSYAILFGKAAGGSTYISSDTGGQTHLRGPLNTTNAQVRLTGTQTYLRGTSGIFAEHTFNVADLTTTPTALIGHAGNTLGAITLDSSLDLTGGVLSVDQANTLTWPAENTILVSNGTDDFKAFAGGTLSWDGEALTVLSATGATASNVLIGSIQGGSIDAAAYNNTGIGGGALDALTFGFQNVALGTNAAGNLSSGTNNTIAGSAAGFRITTGTYNTIYGRSAQYGDVTLSTAVSYVSVFGGLAANANQANSISAFGYYAMVSNTTGIANSGFGFRVLRYNQTGSYNSAFGHEAVNGTSTQSHTGNSGFGFRALYTGYGNYNSGFGYEAGLSLTTGIGNSFVGSAAGEGITTGNYNVVIQPHTALTTGIITGSYNTILGLATGLTDQSNAIVLADGEGNVRQQWDNLNATWTLTANITLLSDAAPELQFIDDTFKIRTLGTHLDYISGSLHRFYGAGVQITAGGFLRLQNASNNSLITLKNTGATGLSKLSFEVPDGTEVGSYDESTDIWYLNRNVYIGGANSGQSIPSLFFRPDDTELSPTTWRVYASGSNGDFLITDSTAGDTRLRFYDNGGATILYNAASYRLYSKSTVGNANFILGHGATSTVLTYWMRSKYIAGTLDYDFDIYNDQTNSTILNYDNSATTWDFKGNDLVIGEGTESNRYLYMNVASGANAWIEWQTAGFQRFYMGITTNTIWEFHSSNGLIMTADRDTQGVSFSQTVTVGDLTTTPTALVGHNGSGVLGELTVGAGLSISGTELITDPTTLTLQAVTDNGNTTTNSVMIGSATAPSYTLQVAGNASIGGQARIVQTTNNAYSTALSWDELGTDTLVVRNDDETDLNSNYTSIFMRTGGSAGRYTARLITSVLGSGFGRFAIQTRYTGASTFTSEAFVVDNSTANPFIYMPINVAIGSSTSPSYTLDVTGTLGVSGNATFSGDVALSSGNLSVTSADATMLTLNRSTAAGVGITFTNTGGDLANISALSDKSLDFRTNGSSTVGMSIDASQNVSIPNGTLTVADTTTGTADVLMGKTSGDVLREVSVVQNANSGTGSLVLNGTQLVYTPPDISPSGTPTLQQVRDAGATADNYLYLNSGSYNEHYRLDRGVYGNYSLTATQAVTGDTGDGLLVANDNGTGWIIRTRNDSGVTKDTWFSKDGTVGIGSPTMTHPLNVRGDGGNATIGVYATGTYSGMRFYNSSNVHLGYFISNGVTTAGNGYLYSGGLTMVSDSGPSTIASRGYNLQFFTDDSLSDEQERMTITHSDGFVGIHNSSPNYPLDVYRSGSRYVANFNTDQTSTYVRLQAGGTTSGYLGMTSGIKHGYIGGSSSTNTDYAMTFTMNNSSTRGFWWGDTSHDDSLGQGAMSLSTDGQLSVATRISVGGGESEKSPNTDNALTVIGSGTIGMGSGANMANAHVLVGTSTAGLALDTNEVWVEGSDLNLGSSADIDFYNGSQLNARITGGILYVRSNIIGYSTVITSDERFKNIQASYDDQFTKEMQGRMFDEQIGKRWDWKDGKGHASGVIAQTIQRYMPWLVYEANDPFNGAGGYLGVKYDGLFMPVFNEIGFMRGRLTELENRYTEIETREQKQDREIEELRAENKELKRRIDELSAIR